MHVGGGQRAAHLKLISETFDSMFDFSWLLIASICTTLKLLLVNWEQVFPCRMSLRRVIVKRGSTPDSRRWEDFMRDAPARSSLLQIDIDSSLARERHVLFGALDFDDFFHHLRVRSRVVSRWEARFHTCRRLH